MIAFDAKHIAFAHATQSHLDIANAIESIAGGGGSSGTVLDGLLKFIGSDVALTVGSNGVSSTSGQFQETTYTNNTTTKKLGSIGLISQSIGGGGGVNSFAQMGTLELNSNEKDNFSASVGGYSNGGADRSGSGGGFKLLAQGTVTTFDGVNANDNAIGIVAQTIGGGGGIGTISVNTVTNKGNALTIALGGSQLAKGNAGADSTLTAEKTIVTNGALSHGVVAQSIGGGGDLSNAVFQNGVILNNGVTATLGSGAGGAGGNGGAVTATVVDVETRGVGSMGIVVQSIGEGGGLAGVSNAGKILGQEGFSLLPVKFVGNAGSGN